MNSATNSDSKEPVSAIEAEPVLDVIRLVLVRHGEDRGVPGARMLSPLGIEQAQRVARRLAEVTFDSIYTSDMDRASQTCREIRHYHPESPYTSTENLREIAVLQLVPEMNFFIHEREHLAEKREGVAQFVAHVCRHHTCGQRLLAVSHGQVIRYLIRLSKFAAEAVREWQLRTPANAHGPGVPDTPLVWINNTSVSVLDVCPTEVPVLRLLNDVSHLPVTEIT